MSQNVEASSVEAASATGDRLGYQPALDGMRAIAVALVVAYHWLDGQRPFAGGWLGVNIFFVLSGYLITRLLIEEHRAARQISRVSFYQRRIARLLPAYATLLVVVVLLTVFRPAYLNAHTAGVGAVSSMTYSANWVAAYGTPEALGPFAHLWSLSVEEQFYLLWPLALILLLRRRSARTIGWVVGAAALVVFSEVAVRSFIWSNDRPLFAATDGQATGFLLLGCSAALLLPVGRELAESFLGPALRRFGAYAALPLIPFVVFYDHNNANLFYYRGVLFALAICIVVLVLSVVADGPIARALSSAPLVWVGKRSYGIYLWHFAIWYVILRVDASAQLHLTLALAVMIATVLTVAASTASYRYIEQPFLGRRRARL